MELFENKNWTFNVDIVNSFMRCFQTNTRPCWRVCIVTANKNPFVCTIMLEKEKRNYRAYYFTVGQPCFELFKFLKSKNAVCMSE